jgi:2-polyprenyl-3-methyl-5-hydroxy-6-metoxy-1,4-benzoquinol methylase
MIETIRTILDRPFYYDLFNIVIGANHLRNVLVNEYIRPTSSDQILDIGCGSGNMVPFLPEGKYIGIDANPSYIASARQRYGYRGEFICDHVAGMRTEQFGTFQIVLALGLLHHLDDTEASELFRLGFNLLKPGGRLITTDICITPGQSFLARYLLERDRGRFVRDESQYTALARTCFKDVTPHVRKGLLWLPYTHLIMECVR